MLVSANLATCELEVGVLGQNSAHAEGAKQGSFTPVVKDFVQVLSRVEAGFVACAVNLIAKPQHRLVVVSNANDFVIVDRFHDDSFQLNLAQRKPKHTEYALACALGVET